MRRLLLPLLGTALLLAGCSPAPDPGVSVFAAGHTVRLAPLQYCTVQGTDCRQNGAAAQRLTVADGQPVQVSVDDDIAATPWRVEYRTLDDAGHLSAGCSPQFTPDKQYSYQVRVPSGQHLQLINVYQIGGRISADGMRIEFMVRGTWTVLTAPGAQLPKPGETLCPDVAS